MKRQVKQGLLIITAGVVLLIVGTYPLIVLPVSTTIGTIGIFTIAAGVLWSFTRPKSEQ